MPGWRGATRAGGQDAGDRQAARAAASCSPPAARSPSAHRGRRCRLGDTIGDPASARSHVGLKRHLTEQRHLSSSASRLPRPRETLGALAAVRANEIAHVLDDPITDATFSKSSRAERVAHRHFLRVVTMSAARSWIDCASESCASPVRGAGHEEVVELATPRRAGMLDDLHDDGARRSRAVALTMKPSDMSLTPCLRAAGSCRPRSRLAITPIMRGMLGP